MATLLYRLGKFSARRAWLVLAAWLVALGLTIAGMLSFGGTLSSAMSIQGLPAQEVAQSLQASVPQANQAAGKIVFHKIDGSKFTDAEQRAIAEQLQVVEDLSIVDRAIDPFEVDQQRTEQLEKLAEGEKALAEAPATIADAEAELSQGLTKLDKAQTELDTNRKTVAAGLKQVTDGIVQVQGGITALSAINPLTPEQDAQLGALKQQLGQLEGQKQTLLKAQAQIDAGQAEIDANLAKIESGKAELASSKKSLPQQKQELAAGLALAKAAGDFGTVSKDGSIAVANILFTKAQADLETAEKQTVVAAFKDFKLDGVEVEFSQEITQTIEGLLGIGEVIGLVIALIVLLVMLGSFVAAGLPLLAAIIGVGVSATFTMALSGVIQMTSTTPILGVMLGLAVGIDYSLFILNRHRRQLKNGVELHESIALANGTSGNAVLFAGLTVIIALVALNLTGIEFLGLMGTFAAAAIAISVLVALTMTPAMMRLVGMRVLTRKERKAFAASSVESRAAAEKATEESQKSRTIWASKHPWLALAATFGILLTAAIPAASMRLGLPDGASEAPDTTQYRAYELITEGFGAGANGQIAAVVSLPQKLGETELLQTKADLATRFAELKNVDSVVPAVDSEDGTKVLFQILPTSGPNSLDTQQVVADLRKAETSIEQQFNVDLGVTGFTAINIDLSQKLADALPLYLGVVLLLSMILMVMVFRSLLVPLLGSLGFLFTVVATLGVVTAVYQWGWLGWLFDVHQPAPLLNFLPTMLIGILFGLAMDYQLFLVSGMREAWAHGESAREAINHGVRGGRAVVIAAAIIMISVFGSFAFSHLAMVRPIGLGLAIGVLADAFIVRLLFVPATMRLFGKAAWWLPKWLDRILPDLDVEGTKLAKSAH